MQRNLRPQVLLCLAMVLLFGGSHTAAWCDQQSHDDFGGNARGPDIYLMKTDAQGSSPGLREDETTRPRRGAVSLAILIVWLGSVAVYHLAVGMVEVVSPRTMSRLCRGPSRERLVRSQRAVVSLAGVLWLVLWAVALYRDRLLDFGHGDLLFGMLGLCLLLRGLFPSFLFGPHDFSRRRELFSKTSDAYIRVHGVLCLGVAAVIAVPAACSILWTPWD
jgi:hypothetical protein